MKTSPLSPFGVEVRVPDGTPWSSLDLQALLRLTDAHRLVVVRGMADQAPEELARDARALGRLQAWRFGAVHELKVDPEAENYLYTPREVPLHWDGAFAEEVPHYLLFRCVDAPDPGAGGETIFVDTARVWERADPVRRDRWGRARIRYTTEKKAHYGGTFEADVVQTHPDGGTVLRYAEPVLDLNPVTAEPIGFGPELHAELREAVYDPEVLIAHAWQPGDLVLADNHRLLHGRRAFDRRTTRHLLRVNVLDPKPGLREKLKASWRLRRPEFLRAELPILLLPLGLAADGLESLLQIAVLDVVLLFFLWFHLGDLVNCLLDRDVDVHRKTHLSEAVRTLGVRNVKLQIAGTASAALAVAAHLAVGLQRWDLAALAVVGVVAGAQYTAPPIRMKDRGRWQIAAYMGLLFLFPMSFVELAVTGSVSLFGLGVASAFAAMQSGILLVNNAEDLDEDEREGIRTASVVLGAAGAVRVARRMAVVGGGSLAVLLGVQPLDSAPVLGTLAVAPLFVTTMRTDRWLRALEQRTAYLSEAGAREAIRKQGKHVPERIEHGAWAALPIAALLFFLG